VSRVYERAVNPAQLPQLHTFLAVARLRSFTAAARELGVSTPAVSQAVRQLEEQLRVALLVRTTRSVSLTDEGRRLVESGGPAVGQALAALSEVSARPGEVVGRLRITVPHGAVPHVISPVLPTFRERHPRIELEITAEDRFVDIVAEGYDAGVRLSEAIERDMVQVRLTKEFRFVIVASPRYLARRGTPERPEDLLDHDCITYRLQSTGTLYAWELERGKRTWRLPVRGGIVTNDTHLCYALVEQGLGLAYAFEPQVEDALRDGRLVRVLEPYAASVPGFFLYYPSRAQSSAPLRLFVETLKEVASVTRGRTGTRR
jgi:DNA-binding transcriptional LysR family regulator